MTRIAAAYVVWTGLLPSQLPSVRIQEATSCPRCAENGLNRTLMPHGGGT